MLKQEIATKDAFLDSTSLLILADDWFGKWMERFLKVCNRQLAGIGEWSGNVQSIIKKRANPFQSV